MSTQNPKTGAPASSAQGSHHWLLTLELPSRAMCTQNGTWTPPAGMTRKDAYLALRDALVAQQPELARANTVFFSLEPNQL